jgi:hypothetical protein
VMMQFSPGKKKLAELVMNYWIKNERVDFHAYIISGFPSRRRRFLKLSKEFLHGWLRGSWMIS